jgi:hypothetical protein
MDSCDLIVSMEHAEISPRPAVGAIVVVSGLAVSFLLWLLYVHHASADFAGRWMFLPALNALLNGLCAIALCVGLYFMGSATTDRITWLAKMERYSVRTGPWPGKIVSPCSAWFTM